VALAALVATSASSAVASTALSQPPPTSCRGVFDGGGDGPLTKSLIARVDNHDGTATYTFSIVTPRPAAQYEMLRDCGYALGQNTRTATYGAVIKPVTMTALAGGGSIVTTTLTVPSGITICDRVALSGRAVRSPGSFTDKSNVLCSDVPTSVPELVPGWPAIVLGGLAVVAVVAIGRRLRARAPGKPAG